MAFQRTFTTTASTAPHWPSVMQTLMGQDATLGGSPVLGDPRSISLDKSTAWTVQQITQVQTVIDNAPRDTDQLRAQFEVDSLSITQKAIILTLLDQINVLRQAAGLATVTPAQAIAAIRTKAGTL